MATWSVQEDGGGDFTTLASALSDAGTGANDVINIEGSWTNDDTSGATVQDDNITINALSTSKHAGLIANLGASSEGHYRLFQGSAAHVITVSNIGLSINGVVIIQSSTSSSKEGIRLSITGTYTVKDCIIYADAVISSQDGIYLNGSNSTLNITNTYIYGFHRGGIHSQNKDDCTINANSCGFWNNGAANSGDGAGFDGSGGIVVSRDPTGFVVNAFNCWSLGNTIGTNAKDFEQNYSSGSTTWNLDNCISSDTSISGNDSGAVGALESRTIRDATAGGDEVLVNDITTAPNDMTLIDDATNNDAQDAHSNTTGAGLTLPTLDIAGTTRDTASGKVDIGPFAFAAAGGGGGIEILRRRIEGA